MSDQATLMCASCDVPVKSRVDAPGDADSVFCPECGIEDTLAAAAAEANDYVRELESQAVMADLRRVVNGSGEAAGEGDGELREKPRAAKTFRFKAEYAASGTGCGCGSGGCGS